MAPVSLRGYNTEIDHLIDNNQLDEAIAHCIHIISKYPKHVDTYRLLGKAFLERQRYADAAEIFLRVLAVFPDDFVAHIGISIVREEQADLNSAIYHMERAFEVQPSNTAIQDELKRLYGKRDGVTPVKIRLTHPALAKLYSKGSLYQQAIGELRVALNDAPNRPDILAQLADLCTKENQTSDAIDVCNQLIGQLPYCMGALNVLTKLLPGTPSAGQVPVYQSRLNELDPYIAFLSSPDQDLDDVDADAITMEPLIWSPDSQLSVNKSDWAANLGIVLIDPAQFEPATVQKKSPTTPFTGPQDIPTQPRARTSTPPTQAMPAPAEELPDWMKSAGWSRSESGTGTLSEENVAPMEDKKDSTKDLQPEVVGKEEPVPEPEKPDGETAPLEPAAAILPAAIPDWLRPIVPPDSMDMDEATALGNDRSASDAVDDAFKSLFPRPASTLDEINDSEPGPGEPSDAFEDVLTNRLEPEIPPEPTVEESLTESPTRSSQNETRTLESSVAPSDLPPTKGATQELNIPTEEPEPATPDNDDNKVPEDADPFASLRSSFNLHDSQPAPAEVPTALPEDLPAEAIPDPPPAMEGTPPVQSDIPEWLLNLGETPTRRPESSERPNENSDSDALPAWLQDFEQKVDTQSPAIEEPVPTEPVESPPAPSHGAPTMILNWSAEQGTSTEEKFPTKELPSEGPQPPSESEPGTIEPATQPDGAPALVEDRSEQTVESEAPIQEKPSEPTVEESSPDTEPPFIPMQASEDAGASPGAESEEESDERPAWLSKLAGIDDIEIPAPTPREEGPVIPGPRESAPDHMEVIPEDIQSAWTMDSVDEKAPPETSPAEIPGTPPFQEMPSQPISEETPDLETGEPELTGPTIPQSATVVSTSEIAAAVAPDQEKSSESPEGEPVPDLSLIVEGLQAAWMAERHEDKPASHPESAENVIPTPSESPSTMIEQAVEPSDIGTTPDLPVTDQGESAEAVPPVVPPFETSEETVRIPSSPPKVQPEKKPSPSPATFMAEEILKDARAANSHGIVDESLDRYVELIHRNRLLDSVIEDLETMSVTHPDIVDIWQTLGDAYTRRNKLDQALSAYQKAESLLK